MDEQFNSLGDKKSGELIRAEEWNYIISAVESLDTRLTTEVSDLSTRVDEEFASVNEELDQVKTDVSALTEAFNTFRSTVEPLLDEYYRLTLKTTETDYAIGELAEIEAQVTDLQGNPPDGQLWIDFVATWGHVRTASGFTSNATIGAGNRSISVRTNSDGLARIRLSADHATDASEEDEEQMWNIMKTAVAHNSPAISAAEIIIKANTPQDDEVRYAYQTFTKAYEDSPVMQRYVDSYYASREWGQASWAWPTSYGHWRHYSSTVLAFVKRDSDPTTPDQSRGAGSIQVTFRDWIDSWIDDYFEVEEDDPWQEDIYDKLENAWQAEAAADKLQQAQMVIQDEVDGLGLLGKQRAYQMIDKALKGLPQPPDDPLVKQMQNAIALQQAVETSQAAAVGFSGKEAALDLFTGVAARSETNVSGMQDGLTGLGQQIDGIQQGISDANINVANVQEQMGLVQQDFIRVSSGLDNQQNEMVRLDTGLRNVDSQIVNVQSSLGSVGQRLDQAEAVGGNLNSKYTSLEQTVLELDRLEPSEITTKLDYTRLSERVDAIAGISPG